MTLAVMGCVVNGPGESKAANIGISLPGTGEAPNCPVYIDGEHVTTLRGTYDELATGFRELVDNYVATKYRATRVRRFACRGGPPESRATVLSPVLLIGRRRTRDEACAPLEREIGSRPLQHDDDSVAKANQNHDVEKEPCQPGERPGELDPAEIGDR